MTSIELGNLYGENIRKIRQEKELSQESLSEKAEISPGFLSEIENHKKTGIFDTFAKIADAPYELLLPSNTCVSLDLKKTKNLIKHLRKNVSDFMDTIESFLEE